MKWIVLSTPVLAALVFSNLVAAADPVAPSIEQKRKAEVFRGAGGRELADRPGKTVRGSEIPNRDRFPGLASEDELKWLRDEAMGEDFAVNLTLARAWQDVVGGSAPGWTGKVAPEIVPGTVITSENYKSFADLEKLLPPSIYARLAPGAWDPVKEIHVGETDQFFPTREYIEATRRHRYAPSGFTIKDWQGGMPFPKAENGDQALMNFLYRYWIDDLTFGFKWYLVGSANNLERTISGRMYGMRFNGRTLVDPKPVYGGAYGGVLEKIGTLIESPKDVRGLALSRTRHVDMTVMDSIQYYLPALRRVRRLSGRDTQDPIAGTDITWDDYVGFYQQISPESAEVKLVGDVEVLHPSSYTKPVADAEGKYLHNASPFDPADMSTRFRKWQRRPARVVDVISKDPSYMYRRRRLWIDKEIPNILYIDTEDRKGNHWKTMWIAYVYNPVNGDASTNDWADFADDLNRHKTTWIFEWESLPGLTPDDFDTSLLTKKTQ